MSRFTTRPEVTGTFGAATSTHWIASSVGMKMLEADGTAADAAVAMGFVLHLLEPHLNGAGGDLPALVFDPNRGRTEVICGQGPAPAGATIEAYRAEGLEIIPGSGLLATVVPGAFDAWMLLLRDYGRLPLRDVLAPAVHYAEQGVPLLPRAADIIAGLGDFFRRSWPGSAAVWLPGGTPPRGGALFRQPALAATWRRILAEAESRPGREAQIEAARDAFYRGFVAEAIDAFIRTEEPVDAGGHPHRGVLTADDLAGYRAGKEAPLTYDYHGWTLAKTGPWGQGPVLAQALSLLAGDDLAGLDPAGADFIHLVVEAMKLAYADRDAYYGDPAAAAVPLETLLSPGYAAARRGLITASASRDLRPGAVPGFDAQVQAFLAQVETIGVSRTAVYEPTMAHLADRRGDTVHLDVIDRWGMMVSATPSGGWLQSSPVIPDLGFCLNTRAQMFWLTPGLPTSLAPGRRPRTTLTPSIARHADGAALAFGTPGGDQQDQWQLSFFLRHVHHGLNLQEAIDLPLFHTAHFNSSFHPRTRQPGVITVERSVGDGVLAELRARGHEVEVAEPWTVGRLTAARREPDGLLKAAATPRLMQAYAVAR